MILLFLNVQGHFVKSVPVLCPCFISFNLHIKKKIIRFVTLNQKTHFTKL